MSRGWREFEAETAVGRGAERFAVLRELVLGWGVQRGAGLREETASERVEPGLEATVRIGAGPFAVRAPVRVVEVFDEPGRAGFVYEALPGHPEEGTEAFVVTMGEDGELRFRVGARARPGRWWSRLGAPLTRLLQDRYTRRYLRAVREA